MARSYSELQAAVAGDTRDLYAKKLRDVVAAY